MTKLTKRDLMLQIEKLSHDPIWGCFTRAALQIRWSEFTQNAESVVYCDIDNMHDLNKEYGHKEVDSKIRKVVSDVRHTSLSRHGDIVASRWLNGDELVFILKSGNPQQFTERIQANLVDEGINATFAYSYVICDTPEETINPLDGKVQQAKNRNNRGVIIAC